MLNLTNRMAWSCATGRIHITQEENIQKYMYIINEYQIPYSWISITDMLRCMHVQSVLSYLKPGNYIMEIIIIRFNQETNLYVTSNMAQIVHNRSTSIRTITV